MSDFYILAVVAAGIWGASTVLVSGTYVACLYSRRVRRSVMG